MITFLYPDGRLICILLYDDFHWGWICPHVKVFETTTNLILGMKLSVIIVWISFYSQKISCLKFVDSSWQWSSEHSNLFGKKIYIQEMPHAGTYFVINYIFWLCMLDTYLYKNNSDQLHHFSGLGTFLGQYKCDKFCNKLCLQINIFTDFGTCTHFDSRWFYSTWKWKCSAFISQSSLYDIHFYFQVHIKRKGYLV